MRAPLYRLRVCFCQKLTSPCCNPRIILKTPSWRTPEEHLEPLERLRVVFLQPDNRLEWFYISNIQDPHLTRGLRIFNQGEKYYRKRYFEEDRLYAVFNNNSMWSFYLTDSHKLICETFESKSSLILHAGTSIYPKHPSHLSWRAGVLLSTRQKFQPIILIVSMVWRTRGRARASSSLIGDIMKIILNKGILK